MTELEPIRIGSKLVGPGQPVYVIAEAGVNHNGDVEVAKTMCAAALDAGADAVKFQAFKCDEFLSDVAEMAGYQKMNTPGKQSQREMLEALELSADEFREIKRYCTEIGIEFLAAPFDLPSLDMLLDIGLAAIKIASPEITDLPVLHKAAESGLPIIISTGAADEGEVEAALRLVPSKNCDQVILLHCVSAYPVPFDNQDFPTIPELRDKFERVVGYSDHSREVVSGALAVAIGASVVEKHFTLDCSQMGPDHAMSLEPDRLAEYVLLAGAVLPFETGDGPQDEHIRLLRKAFPAIGTVRRVPNPIEFESRDVSRKSVFSVVTITVGEVIKPEMLKMMRPGTGIPPTRVGEVIGQVAQEDIPAGRMITMEMLGGVLT